MKKIFGILLFTMCTLMSGTAMAQNEIKESPAYSLFSQFDDIDVDALFNIDEDLLVRFIIQECPELDESNYEEVKATIDMMKAIAEERYLEALQIYGEYKDKIIEIVELITPYIEKDLPLYIYLMSNRTTPPMADVSDFSVDTVWAAPVDEMYYGLGDERNTYKPFGFSPEEQEAAIADGARVKHNQSYLWGMVTVGDKVLWCTNTNYLCVGGTSGLGSVSEPGADVGQGYSNDCWVCEFESGIYGKTVHAAVDPSYAQYSDTRIPRIYSYDTTTGIVLDITPSGGDYDMMLQDCQGLRSAGAHNGVTFFGGPSLYGSSAGTTIGSSFFAYDNDAEQFIGCNDMSKVLDADGLEHKVTDIRRWMVYDDILYAGVRVTDANGVDRGAILRWYGDKEDPWQFKVVGWTTNEAAELCVYDGRIYVGGWNTNNLKVSTVAKGDIMPEGGLQPVSIDYPEY